ncbi:MAG: hypothetical protein ABFE07_28545 [Armatimonadia bacterium]
MAKKSKGEKKPAPELQHCRKCGTIDNDGCGVCHQCGSKEFASCVDRANDTDKLMRSIWALKGAVEKLTEELAKPRPPTFVYVYPQSPYAWWWNGSEYVPGQIHYGSGDTIPQGPSMTFNGGDVSASGWTMRFGPTPPPAPPSPSSGKPLA